jgi:hypothetical protein
VAKEKIFNQKSFNNILGTPLGCRIKITELLTLVLFSGAWGKMIHEKPEAKNLMTLFL